MTKLQKINKLEGRVQAIVKNLLTVDGKNISVPIDVTVNGEVGDTIRIEYDDRGFLKSSELVKKRPQDNSDMWIDSSKGAIDPEHKELETTRLDDVIKKASEQIEIKRFIPDQMFLQKLISLQTCYKELMETIRSLILIPDAVLDEGEYERYCELAVGGAMKDAKALIEAAAGDGK